MTGRRFTTGVTLSALVVVLVVMAVWGYRQATKPVSGDDDKASSCTKAEISKQTYVHRKDVTVSVYNSGARKGFAALTLQRLEALGFNPGSVANAPKDSSVARAKVFTTHTDDTAAELVARTLGKSVPVEVTDDPMGPGIDVYVGKSQHHLAKHAPSRLKLPKPVEHCVKVD